MSSAAIRAAKITHWKTGGFIVRRLGKAPVKKINISHFYIHILKFVYSSIKRMRAIRNISYK